MAKNQFPLISSVIVSDAENKVTIILLISTHGSHVSIQIYTREDKENPVPHKEETSGKE